VTNGPLTAPANAGVYTYGAASAFPSNNFGAENYWVDVLFNPFTPTTNLSPVANSDSGFSTPMDTALMIPVSSLLINDMDPDGHPLSITGVSAATHGTVTFDAQNNTITFMPAAGYTGPAGFTYAISDGHGGTASATVSLSIDASSTTLVSVFSASATPAIQSASDSNPVELGMKFQVSTAGSVVGIKFYK
jgi:hypothetical protein